MSQLRQARVMGGRLSRLAHCRCRFFFSAPLCTSCSCSFVSPAGCAFLCDAMSTRRGGSSVESTAGDAPQPGGPCPRSRRPRAPLHALLPSARSARDPCLCVQGRFRKSLHAQLRSFRRAHPPAPPSRSRPFRWLAAPAGATGTLLAGTWLGSSSSVSWVQQMQAACSDGAAQRAL